MSQSKLDASEASQRARAVFCNRTLNLRAIKAVGYDMDYTLIHYRVPEWEGRAFTHARADLLAQGWPVGDLSFDPDSEIQGLIIDRQQGNLLKVNRFGLVKSARHGTRPLDFEQQRALYGHVIVDHREPRFAIMATLFSLSESSLFAQLVERFDAGVLPEVADYAELYAHVRAAINRIHQQGALKAEIIADIDRFVQRDADTVPTLLDQRESGKKLLLITNSEWSYTRQMMHAVFDPDMPKGQTWQDLFDLKIVSARKPDFFRGRSPLLQVVDNAGLLKACAGLPDASAVYFGGNAEGVERALGLSGDQILYVGDHFFGDVHASKGALRWRTALVMRELEQEILDAAAFAPQTQQLMAGMARKEQLEEQQCQLRIQLTRSRSGRRPLRKPEIEKITGQLDQIKQQLTDLDAQIAPLAAQAAQLGNAHWGPAMRAGNDKSYLAFLIERHADIYTSRVSNFLPATPYRYFRAARGSLPHDLI